MNKILSILIFSLSLSISSFAQITHTIDGKSYELIEEITGTTSLFYVIDEGEYRYFIKKDDSITELTNTKDENGKYQDEYKEILSILTADKSMDISKVNLTLGSLRSYVDEYNKASDINYRLQAERPETKLRLGAFGGMSNNPFVTNTENVFVPIFGVEAEVYDEKRSRHSLGLMFKQSLEANEFKYSSSQFGLFYRFRIINKETFSIYPQATLATYTFSKSETTNTVGATTTVTKNSGSALDAPIILGIGTDIKLGNGYITLSANELFGLIKIENKGNTPLDLRLGYKFNL